MPSQLPVFFIVEDDDAVRQSLELLTRALGWDVRAFQSAEKCLDQALYQPPACILADLFMPRMNAVELKKALQPAGVQTPMVILTAYMDTPLAAAAKSMGIDEVISKPCDCDQLHNSIERAVRRQRRPLAVI